MFAKVVRAMLAAVAWSGLWAVVLATEPRLWTQPVNESGERWQLYAAPGGRFVWEATTGGTGINGPASREESRYTGLDGQPCARPWGDWDRRGGGWIEVAQPVLAPAPIEPRGPRVYCVAAPFSECGLGGSVGSYVGGDGSIPGEYWCLVTDATRRRFHLVGYTGQPRRATLWFARGGFVDHRPVERDWFEATCDPSCAAQQSLPDPRLRPGLEQQKAWPQPWSVLLLADGAVLSVDTATHRWRTLLGPCGIERFARPIDSGAQLDRQEPDEAKQRVIMPTLAIIARAGDWVYRADCTAGRVARMRLPAALRGQRACYQRLADGSVAAVSDPAAEDRSRLLVSHGNSSEPGAVPDKPLLVTWSRADGTLLRQTSVDFSRLRVPPTERRAVLVAACPLGLLWQEPERRHDGGVALGLRWAQRVQAALALAVLAGSRNVGWALLTLAFGLPGVLAGLSQGWRRAGPGRADPLRPRRGPSRPLWALFGKDLRCLAPSILVAAAVMAGIAWRTGLPKLQAFYGGFYSTDQTLVGALRDLPRSLSGLAIAWAVWLAWRLASDERWAWLLTRRADRRRALLTKLAAGLCAAAAVGCAPLLTVAAIAWCPGVCAGPVTWAMARPPAAVGAGTVIAYLLAAGVALAWLGSVGRVSSTTLNRLVEPRPAAGWAALMLTLLVLCVPRSVSRPEGTALEALRHEHELGEQRVDLNPMAEDKKRVAVGVSLDGHVVMARRLGAGVEIVGLDGSQGSAGSANFVGLRAAAEPRWRDGTGTWVEPLGCDARAWWYLLFGPGNDQRYRLVAFDRRSGRCLGWLSHRGHTLHRPASRDSFEAADGGFVIESNRPERAFVVGDRGRLRRLALGRGQGQTLIELPGLRAFRDVGNAYDARDSYAAVSADRLVMPADGTWAAGVYDLPPGWRDQVWVARQNNGQVVVFDPSFNEPDSRRLVWLKPGGGIARQVVVTTVFDRQRG